MSMSSTAREEQDRQQIIAAAQRCFLRSGLHGTSMEDIAGESGMTTAAVARHFADRDQLVAGIAANILRLISEVFQQIRNADPVPPMGEVIERFAEAVLAFSGADGPGRLAPIFWASALYSTDMAERARPPIRRGRAGWTEIAERERALGRLAPGADPEAVGTVLACLMPGIVLQHMLFEDVDAATFRRGVEGLLGPIR